MMENLKKYAIFVLMAALALQMTVPKLSLAASPGVVVINEVAWAGSVSSSSDEWIELYNTSGQAVDLSGWVIEDDGVAGAALSGSIEPGGYFLIDDTVVPVSLANSGDSLVLKDASGVVIDAVNSSGGAWFAGDSTDKSSMERIDPLVAGDEAGNWASAVGGSGMLGTPMGLNSVFAGGGPRIRMADMDAVAGEMLTVTVEAVEMQDLYSYGFEIQYDAAVLNLVSTVEGGFLNSDGTQTAFNAALENGNEGTLIVGNTRILNLPAGVSGDGELFEMNFEVIGGIGSSSELAFVAGSFVADADGDVVTVLRNGSVVVGDGSVDAVRGLTIELGAEVYTLALNWDVVTGADSYVVERKMPDGSFAAVAEVGEPSYVDAYSLVNAVAYEYQVYALKNGVRSEFALGNGMETRGLSGDNDQSGRVDGRDLDNLSRFYAASFGEVRYELLKDSNYDGSVDGGDLIDIGVNFGLSI